MTRSSPSLLLCPEPALFPLPLSLRPSSSRLRTPLWANLAHPEEDPNEAAAGDSDNIVPDDVAMEQGDTDRLEDLSGRLWSKAALRRRLSLTTVTVPAGHVLYMPAGWFHHVENLAPTVMANYWLGAGPKIGMLGGNGKDWAPKGTPTDAGSGRGRYPGTRYFAG